MTLGEFLVKTHGMPLDTMIVVDEGDCRSFETDVRHRMPAWGPHVPLIVIGLGQSWDDEIEYGPRLDHHLEYGDD